MNKKRVSGSDFKELAEVTLIVLREKTEEMEVDGCVSNRFIDDNIESACFLQFTSAEELRDYLVTQNDTELSIAYAYKLAKALYMHAN
ncbi:MAG: hypothetical protein MI748_20820 [Opitutales bacterium]|nr:hypothetical protein [Opitutales bacterium]